ncbi:class I SAM-dependent methyltransferase [Vibrio sp. HN007]|uniref:class I SAM-dependent methyltransferase n=1 Tax=Vibrio iocasae TaxID=3098914 RepID=UPI0035D404C1
MAKYTIERLLPKFIKTKLFGERDKYGYVPVEGDSCWVEWQKNHHKFYESTQKNGVGKVVNDAGYQILKDIDLEGKRVLEIGPGALAHKHYWSTIPKEYVLVDIDDDFLSKAANVLSESDIKYNKVLVSRDDGFKLPFKEQEFDIIISFFSLEHLYPIESYLSEFYRVLKNEGELVGAIPSEGGFAWGLGRYLTSRRWLLKNTTINPDKIICWEHPNFANKILNECKKVFGNGNTKYWPLKLHVIDMNLVIKFRYKKI